MGSVHSHERGISHWWVRLGLLLVLSIFLNESIRPVEQADDAYITYRYAQNLADGRGLVFNAGEYVEGYTNFSWGLLVAAGVVLGLEAPVAGHWLGLLCGLALLIVTYLYAASFLQSRQRGWAILAPLLLLASNSFVHWTMSGLETPLFAFLMVSGLWAYRLGKLWWLSALMILASMTRPEGMLLAGMLLGWSWWHAVRERVTDFRGLVVVSGPALLYAVYLIAHTAFRLQYYGALLPNTFYAKVGGIPLQRGFWDVYESLAEGGFIWLMLCAVAAARFKSLRLPLVVSIVFLAYFVKVGGDVFAMGRYFLPLLPVWLAGSVALIAGECAARVRRVVVACLLLLSFVGCLYFVPPKSRDFYAVAQKPFPSLNKRRHAHNHADFGITEVSVRSWVERMRADFPVLKTVATIGIGKLGYVAMDIRIVDMVGLVDAHIARSKKVVPAALVLPGHQRTDSDYVLAQNHDMIWIPPIGENRGFALPCVEDMWANPILQERYVWTPQYMVWIRKDLVGA